MKEQLSQDRTTPNIRSGAAYMPLRTFRTIVIGITLVVIGFGFGYQAREVRSTFPVPASFGQSATPLERDDLDFAMFWNVWDALHQAYLDPEQLDSQKLIYGAIEGMTAAVGDPYTVFLPPDDNQRSKEDLNGEFDGVGIQLGYKRDTLAVMTPLDDHPAIKKGVKAGDLILHIADTAKEVDVDTDGMSLQEAVSIIRGKRGTPVTLTLYREDKGTFDVEIIRDTITIPSVEHELGNWTGVEFEESDNGTVVHVKVRRFGELTQEQWDEAVRTIIQNRDRIDGVVLDLRNNPGGFLRGAISLASDFIPEGVVVEQKGRFGGEKYEVDRRGRLLGVPVVILINGGSASASEIMAGAMRDRLKTPLVGETSFGKGTVQEAVDLTGNAGLHVTTSRWLLPSGDWIHDTGITPDFEIDLPDVDEASDEADFVDTQLQKAIEVLRSS